MVTAFGETKCLMDWVNDPRCNISYSGLRGRLLDGVDAESSISNPPLAIGFRRWSKKQITANGETKSITDWTKDQRCTVGRSQITKRLKLGWTPEDAIMKRSKKALITIGGETKSLVAWSNDPRCTVSRGQIEKRLRQGMSQEDAILKRSRNAH